LTREEIIDMFKNTGALLEGHFLLTSGRHSDRYIQCAKVFQYPKHSEIICRQLAEEIKDAGIDVDLVIGPAIGGIILSYEMGRALGVKNIFAEREEGIMTLRRGFEIQPGERLLVVEDVVTTGGSVKEVINLIENAGGRVVAVSSVVDRSGGRVDFGVPSFSLIRMEVQSYSSDECPLCRQGGIPLVKPGSRGIKQLKG
jgi:orotate phosphoribosyltransferase